MPAISELIQAKLTPLFPNNYGPLTSITTPHWDYIAGDKARRGAFPVLHQRAGVGQFGQLTEEGRHVCQAFRKELAFSSEKPHVVTQPLHEQISPLP